jgi:hypothetical protein
MRICDPSSAAQPHVGLPCNKPQPQERKCRQKDSLLPVISSLGGVWLAIPIPYSDSFQRETYRPTYIYIHSSAQLLLILICGWATQQKNESHLGWRSHFHGIKNHCEHVSHTQDNFETLGILADAHDRDLQTKRKYMEIHKDHSYSRWFFSPCLMGQSPFWMLFLTIFCKCDKKAGNPGCHKPDSCGDGWFIAHDGDDFFGMVYGKPGLPHYIILNSQWNIITNHPQNNKSETSHCYNPTVIPFWNLS